MQPKPLHWQLVPESGGERETASTPFGLYELWRYPHGCIVNFLQREGAPGAERLFEERGSTPEDARAAAALDWQKRVSNCLARPGRSAPLPDDLLELARELDLHVEDGEVLLSENQGGSFASAIVCIDRWLCVRDGEPRLQLRALARLTPEASWEPIAEGEFSEPITHEQARQMLAHWGRLSRALRQI